MDAAADSRLQKLTKTMTLTPHSNQMQLGHLQWTVVKPEVTFCHFEPQIEELINLRADAEIPVLQHLEQHSEDVAVDVVVDVVVDVDVAVDVDVDV